MAKGDNSLTVKLTMTSSNLFPWNLNMARENTLTVPGTANGNNSKMGQGTITSTRVLLITELHIHKYKPLKRVSFVGML